MITMWDKNILVWKPFFRNVPILVSSRYLCRFLCNARKGITFQLSLVRSFKEPDHNAEVLLIGRSNMHVVVSRYTYTFEMPTPLAAAAAV